MPSGYDGAGGFWATMMRPYPQTRWDMGLNAMLFSSDVNGLLGPMAISPGSSSNFSIGSRTGAYYTPGPVGYDTQGYMDAYWNYYR